MFADMGPQDVPRQLGETRVHDLLEIDVYGDLALVKVKADAWKKDINNHDIAAIIRKLNEGPHELAFDLEEVPGVSMMKRVVGGLVAVYSENGRQRVHATNLSADTEDYLARSFGFMLEVHPDRNALLEAAGCGNEVSPGVGDEIVSSLQRNLKISSSLRPSRPTYNETVPLLSHDTEEARIVVVQADSIPEEIEPTQDFKKNLAAELDGVELPVILDLRRVNNIGSLGWKVIADAAQSLANQRLNLSLKNVSDRVRDGYNNRQLYLYIDLLPEE